MNHIFNKKARPQDFQPRDLVLLWDKRHKKYGKHKKFDSLWLSPFIIDDIKGVNSLLLSNLDGKQQEFPMNGRHLKHFIS
jgi:hypothetical protein